MNPLNNIRTLKDLRERKEQLKLEVEASRKALDYRVAHFITYKDIRRVALKAALSGLVIQGLRLLLQPRSSTEEQSEGKDYGKSWMDLLLPILRTFLPLVIQFVKNQFQDGIRTEE